MDFFKELKTLILLLFIFWDALVIYSLRKEFEASILDSINEIHYYLIQSQNLLSIDLI